MFHNAKAKPITFPSLILKFALMALTGALVWSGYSYAFCCQDFNTERLSDADIVEAIERKMAYDGLDAEKLKVFATDGIVTLDGLAASLSDKDRVTAIARGIRNVRGVVDQVKVQASSLTDEEIKSSVVRRFRKNSATDSYEIDVAVEDGNVKLSGTVQSLAEQMLARNVAAEVTGVRAITSEITIRDSQPRDDDEILADIRGRLEQDIWIDHQMVEVEVKNGNVLLSGSVADAGQRDRLNLLALTSGVKSISAENVDVDAKLNVVPKKLTRVRNDVQIKRALEDALRLDPRVDVKNLQFAVKQGIVKIFGTVDDTQSKRNAVRTAENVTGVANVIDEITVTLASPLSDEEIQMELQAAFDQTATLKYDGITSNVNAGIVTLSGMVPSQYQRRRVAAIAESLHGVLEVDNQVKIDNQQPDQSDFEIKMAIERGIRWNPYLNITKLGFTVKDGIVTFSGTVSDRASLEMARATAIDAGARDLRTTDVKIDDFQ